MRMWIGALVVALLSPAGASFLESSSGGLLEYQFDGESHRDAPGMCQQVDAEWTLEPNGRTDGMLVPVDDRSDHFLLNVTPEDLGRRLSITLHEASTVAGDIKARLDVLAPFCDGSVLDAHNQPPVPPKPGEGQMLIGAENTQATCGERWYFIINGVNAATVPTSIHLIWTDGHQETVPMDSAPPSPVGQYQTTSRLGTTLHMATAVIDENWSGTFRIGEMPCDTVDGGYIFGQTATLVDDTLSFNIREPGTYVVAVHLGDMEPRDPTKPWVVPASCHWCSEEIERLVETMSYSLKGDDAQDQA